METIAAYQAKTHLPALLRRVAEGEQFTITRHGVPVAVLAPPSDVKRSNIAETIKAMRELRKGCRLNGLSLRELIEEGRR